MASQLFSNAGSTKLKRRVRQSVHDPRARDARDALTRRPGRASMSVALSTLTFATLAAGGYFVVASQQQQSTLTGITQIEDAVAVFPEDHTTGPEGWQAVYRPGESIGVQEYWDNIRTMEGQALMLAYANLLHEARSVEGYANLDPATSLLNTMAFELNRRELGGVTAEFYNAAMEPNAPDGGFLQRGAALPVDLKLD